MVSRLSKHTDDNREQKMKAIFVQIKCEKGQAYAVANDLVDDIPQISEVYSTSGQYDLMAKFYLEEEQDAGRFVQDEVHVLSGIRETFTIITFNAFSPGYK